MVGTDALQLYGRDGRIDVIILTVNEEEFKAAVQKFIIRGPDPPPYAKANVGAVTVYFGCVGGPKDPLSIGIIKQTKNGPFEQAFVASEAIQNLKPRAIISVGVGWGNSGKGFENSRLGDVMVSNTLVEFSDNAKVGEDGEILCRPERPHAGKLLSSRFAAAALPRQWHFPWYVGIFPLIEKRFQNIKLLITLGTSHSLRRKGRIQIPALRLPCVY